VFLRQALTLLVDSLDNILPPASWCCVSNPFTTSKGGQDGQFIALEATTPDALWFDEVIRQILDVQHIEEHCRAAEHEWRSSFWSPPVTLLTFLLQVLSAEKTLRAAVASLLTQLAGQKVDHLPSPDPTAYCQARRRLPLGVVERLNEELADRMLAEVGEDHRWHGHRVKKVDGTTVSMPILLNYRRSFPSRSLRSAGVVPLRRLVTLFCGQWRSPSTGYRDLHKSENNLFREHYASGWRWGTWCWVTGTSVRTPTWLA